MVLSVISAAAILAGTVLTGCSRADDLVQEQTETENYALTVFTAQERKEWEPVIKEVEERTGWNVRVETGSAKEMLSQLEKEEADWDVAFGVSADALEEGKEYWQTGKDAWTGYSAVSFVILYNQVIQFWYLSAFSSLLNLLINECFFTHLLILNYCGIYFNMSTNAESFYIL